ncbi:MAG TPA: phosphopantetheine-binding protein [Bacteroidales bacterium]|nr:phosphopantetheine-binding protein [Bacteroidales bacterium]HPS63217.1 phosphopantetheine-binding protein [Bacteroidales bacterium]
MTEPTPELKLEIKNLIMSTLSITDVNPADVDDDAPLFGGGNALTLDSVDAIEIIMAIQRTYGFRIADQNLAREVVRSVNSIARFICEQRDLQNA